MQSSSSLHIGAAPRAGRVQVAQVGGSVAPAEIGALVGQRRGEVVLGGGEPTLRADLPALISSARRAAPDAWLALETDALALTTPAAIGPLVAAGLDAVHVRMFAARTDAADWIGGLPGACRRALRAVRACATAGLTTEVVILLTRPGLALLAETAETAASLGAVGVRVRPVSPSDVAADDVVALVPRFGSLAGPLEALTRITLRRGLNLRIEALPRCLVPVGLRRFLALADSSSTTACAGCTPGCAGVSASYVAAFGVAELRTAEPSPPVSVRVRFAHPAAIACPACAGPAEPTEPSRESRIRLLRAARRRPGRLRLADAGSLAHPAARELLREVARLDVEAVEIEGDVSPLADWSDDDLHRVRKIGSVRGAFFGADAATHDAHAGRPGGFDQSRAVLQRLGALRVPVGAYAILHDARLEGWDAAWAEGRLPGSPAVRLSPVGGSLDALAEACAVASPAVREAVRAVLPACLRPEGADLAVPPAAQWSDDGERLGGVGPSGIDSAGTFSVCSVAAECGAAGRCPGIADGWTSTQIEAQP